MAVTSETLANGITIYRQGKHRLLHLNNAAGGSSGLVYTLAAGDRPAVYSHHSVLMYLSPNYLTGYIIINSDGKVVGRYFQANTSTDQPLGGSGLVFGTCEWYTD